MKNILLMLACLLYLSGCNSKTPAQKAEDEYNAEKEQREAAALVREAYIDSLVNVATGLDDVSKPLNRKNALKILRKEYPTMTEKWDKCEESIDNMELYSE